MNHKLLDVLVCPICKGDQVYKKDSEELICRFDKLAYPIRDDIPVMLENEARIVSSEELDAI